MITVRFEGWSVTFLRDGVPVAYLVSPTPASFNAVMDLFREPPELRLAA